MTYRVYDLNKCAECNSQDELQTVRFLHCHHLFEASICDKCYRDVYKELQNESSEKLKCSYCKAEFAEVWDKAIIRENVSRFDLCSICLAEILNNQKEEQEKLLDNTILIVKFGDKLKFYFRIFADVIKNYFIGER